MRGARIVRDDSLATAPTVLSLVCPLRRLQLDNIMASNGPKSGSCCEKLARPWIEYETSEQV